MTTPQSREIDGLRKKVSDRLSARQNADLVEYLREDEWQLSVELIGDFLEEADLRLTAAEWPTFVKLATAYDLDPNSYDIAPE